MYYLYDQLTNHFSDHENKSNEASRDEPNLCLASRIICDFHMTIAVRFFKGGAGSGKNDDGTTIWNLTNMEGEREREQKDKEENKRKKLCAMYIGWLDSITTVRTKSSNTHCMLRENKSFCLCC